MRRTFYQSPQLTNNHENADRQRSSIPAGSFISENPLVAKLQYGMKITFIFILILFLDSVNRVYRVQLELAAATEGSSNSAYVSSVGPAPRRKDSPVEM